MEATLNSFQTLINKKKKGCPFVHEAGQYFLTSSSTDEAGQFNLFDPRTLCMIYTSNALDGSIAILISIVISDKIGIEDISYNSQREMIAFGMTDEALFYLFDPIQLRMIKKVAPPALKPSAISSNQTRTK